MTAPTYTPEQRNGRQWLVLALTLLGAIPLWTLFIQKSSPVALFAVMAVYGLIFFFACQGGQIALGLLKGLSVLFTLVFTILLCVLAIWHFGDGPPAEAENHRHPLEIILPAVVAYFAVWALFISRSVKAFLRYQRQWREELMQNPS